jgi:hypothetical protein
MLRTLARPRGWLQIGFSNSMVSKKIPAMGPISTFAPIGMLDLG